MPKTLTPREALMKAEARMAAAREFGLTGKTEARDAALREARNLYQAIGMDHMVERIERRLQAAGN